MAEFDDKLNSLLSNPDAMAQIMQLAQSLGGSESNASSASAAQQPVSPISPPFQSAQSNQTPFQSWQNSSAPPAGGDLLSSLTGGMDPKLMMKLLPLIQELGGQQNSNARQLLYALRPYLKADRQEKIERALQLARLFHIGKKFLAEWGG